MTERAMTEGELRTVIATAIREGAQAWSDANAAAGHAVAPYSDYVADAVLAVLRPHLGPGVTERDALEFAINSLETDINDPETFDAWKGEASGYVGVLRAIAGRGEVGGMNHE